jgi:hypothetical protein
MDKKQLLIDLSKLTDRERVEMKKLGIMPNLTSSVPPFISG